MRSFYKYLFYTITVLLLFGTSILAQNNDNKPENISPLPLNNEYQNRTAEHIVRYDISNSELFYTIGFIYTVIP
ncbi:MAG: hypothetical protein JXK07_14965 [Spirochaetes bacterium]|nr:hypothetical protein [Spirochaetota bacterium]MBN2772233.1 hypothetical protein [Spirochaetota bacterium]HRX17038.1 hypothetical protein [Spirochaetota bacterium]